jgi:1-phosphofructokinase
VVTVTPNPSIDLLFETDRLVWEDANRTTMPRRRAGGQGINVARALRVLGADPVAIALLGGAAGDELERLLASEGQPLVRVEAEGDTRVFVAARERETGRSLLLNPRGPASSVSSAEALLQAAGDVVAARSPRWVACCGSVPPGLPMDTYARMAGVARRAGCRFVADCDGDLFRLAVAAGCDLLVPNQHEAERLAGRPIDGVPAAAGVARSLQEEGPVRWRAS